MAVLDRFRPAGGEAERVDSRGCGSAARPVAAASGRRRRRLRRRRAAQARGGTQLDQGATARRPVEAQVMWRNPAPRGDRSALASPWGRGCEGHLGAGSMRAQHHDQRHLDIDDEARHRQTPGAGPRSISASGSVPRHQAQGRRYRPRPDSAPRRWRAHRSDAVDLVDVSQWAKVPEGGLSAEDSVPSALQESTDPPG